jgi:hypothetical protein
MKKLSVFLALSFAASLWGCGDSNPKVDGEDTPMAEPEAVPTATGPTGPTPTGPSQPPGEPDGLVEPEPIGAEPSVEPEASPVDPCEVTNCNVGQRCAVTDGAAACVDLTCEELACSATEACRPHELGGNVCVDVGCSEDVDCELAEFCNTTSGVCEADACVPLTLTCSGDVVLECTSNGASDAEIFACGSEAYFTSACQAAGPDATGCTCADDWDCPAFTTCDVDLCVGTGKEPTCTLPPIAFSDAPPTLEIHWGGDSFENPSAHDGTPEKTPAPWPEHSHVLTVPIVANLDDDNGDGLVNELDFPEIIFFSYEDGNNNTAFGVVRAIHGGGPDKGKDMFAVCNTTTWHEDAPTTEPCTEPSILGRDSLAVGDLDMDGLPEIVFLTADRGIQILNNSGQTLFRSAAGIFEDPTQFGAAAPSIANIDFEGYPEISVGNHVFTLNVATEGMVPAPADGGVMPPTAAGGSLYIEHIYVGGATVGLAVMGPLSCLADVHPQPGQELLAGTTLYSMPERTVCADPPCLGTLNVLWEGTAANPELPNEGFCAIADVWGADPNVAPGPANPPDGRPEAVLIANGWLEIFDGETGTLILARDLEGGSDGGAPNIDDFDGDGFMEIGSSLQDFYVMVDLQAPSENCGEWPEERPRLITDGDTNPNGAVRNPGGACTVETAATDCAADAVCNARLGQCVCLHNGWKRETDDDSSRVTSSSVFDFNGDGAAEVLYNDECEFRVYEGRDGTVLYNEVSRSRTATENPVVADVDNDGNAEAITITNTENEDIRCEDDQPPPVDPPPMVDGGFGPGPGGPQPDIEAAGPNGIQVFGDANDSWVSARRIWNQHAYHVTNVTESGAIPQQEPESWRVHNGRVYNTYRSQPRNYGVAPDLQVAAVSVSSPDVACGELGDQLIIAFEITNAGDIRVGPGVTVSFYGMWEGMEAALVGPDGTPLTYVIQSSIEPGRSLIDSVEFDVANQGTTTLPESVRVVVDSVGEGDFGLERECLEDNNDNGADVVPGEPRPDLSIDVGMATVDCEENIASVPVTVTNSGTTEATGVVVEIYFGDPSAGGMPVTRVTIDEPIPPGGMVTVTATVEEFPFERTIRLWGVVDPDNTVTECNEADNADPADNDIFCKLQGAGAR